MVMRIFRNKKTRKIFRLSECEQENIIREYKKNKDFEELFELEGK